MQKILSYDAFKHIDIGDSINQVKEVDPITLKYIEKFNRYSDKALESHTKEGSGARSIHLLSDGILEFVYKREDKDYIITDMMYSNTFDLQCVSGTYCYKIYDIDYKK